MLPAQKGKRKQTSRGKESADASSKRRRQKLTLIPRSSRKAASRAAATAADRGGKNTGEGKEESPAVDDKVPTLDTIEKEIRGGLPPTLPKTGQAREALAQSLPPAAEILSQASSRPVIETVMDLPPAKSSAPKRKRRTSSTTGWVVAYDFPFEKRSLKGLSFGKELWMMMTAFGDPRGEFTCKCDAKGRERCPCLDAVDAMESLVAKFARRLVAVCREWSERRSFQIKHLRLAMPGEMREFLAWKEARAKSKTDEKIAVTDDNVEADYDTIGPNDVGRLVEGDEGFLEEVKGNPDRGDDEDTLELVEDKELVIEEEEVANRIQHRKTFADEVTADMEDGDYVDTYFEHRKAFFLSTRGCRRDSTPGSRKYFLRFMGMSENSAEGKNRKLLDALAYMLYDYVGLVVETAVRRRSGGRLVALPEGEKLTADEVKAAASRLPPLPSRDQRERVRSMRVANPDGLSSKPMSRFPVGLEYRGDPLKWPCNTIERGQVQVEGGEVVDTAAQTLAQEAMALLETDFADFDS